MLQIFVLSIHPAPYRDFVFQRLYERKRIKIKVAHYYKLDLGHKEWLWTSPPYPHFCSKFGKTSGSLYQLHFDILLQTASSTYDVIVIPGYSRLTSLFSILIARFRRKPVILVLDTIAERKSRGLLASFKRVIKKCLLGLCQGYWVPGVASARYLSGIGVDANIIAQGAYCLCPAKFKSQLEELKDSRKTLRMNLGIDQYSVVVLAVGKMMPFRRYDLLIRSWANLRQDTRKTLLLVGDGPLHSELMAFPEKRGICGVKFIGPCSSNELARYYAIADAYVHPGAEPFSTALELAAIAGLPILANNCVGYVYDLISRGAQPLIFQLDDTVDLTLKLETLTSVNYLKLAKSSLISKEAAAQRTPEWAAQELENLAYLTVNTKLK